MGVHHVYSDPHIDVNRWRSLRRLSHAEVASLINSATGYSRRELRAMNVQKYSETKTRMTISYFFLIKNPRIAETTMPVTTVPMNPNKA